MLPMNMMDALVQFQMNDHRPPLPPVEEMIGEAEARIAKREERLKKIEAIVTAVLEERSVESLAALKDIMADIRTDDPHAAILPQLENAGQAVADCGEVYDSLLEVFEQSNQQLKEKMELYIGLKISLTQLQHTLKSGQNSQIRGFLKECAGKGASYAAKN